jgi:hypothetical protein
MTNRHFLPVAALILAACSETTSPVDFAVAAARHTPLPPADAGETFENGIASLGAWTPTTLSTSPGTSKKAPTTFLGRFTNEPVSLTVPAGASSVTLSFNLYVIGTWDGAGIQGFGADRWQLAVSKSGGAVENVFETSFSNQATKPQNYPRQIDDGGTSPAHTGALSTNTLGYPKGEGKFDVGDAIYGMSFTVSNPSRGEMVFYFRTTTQLQALNDESWGLDNVVVSAN